MDWLTAERYGEKVPWREKPKRPSDLAKRRRILLGEEDDDDPVPASTSDPRPAS